MKPQPAISGRIISEKRAAAARANGAKSRGPVTAQGRANSSRNSFRHGLRAKTHGVVDQDSLDRLATLLASYTRLFQPQSEVERWLVETMALARWRRTRCWQQETEVLNGEIRRLKPLLPDEDPFTLMALAFQSLSGNGCSLDLINRIESRCDRQYDRALDRLTGPLYGGLSLIALKSRPAQSPANGTFEKVNTSERTQQAVENTDPHAGTTHPVETSRAIDRSRKSRSEKSDC